MGELEVTAFLTHLAAQRNVAASTQNQALSALLFLYRDALKVQLDWVDGFERASRPPRVPVVLSKSEVQCVLAALPSKYLLFCRLLYGTGLRLMEGLRLRVKDADFERRQILVDYRPRAGIRVAPHFYTTDDEVEHTIREMRSIAQ